VIGRAGIKYNKVKPLLEKINPAGRKLNVSAIEGMVSVISRPHQSSRTQDSIS